MREGSGRGSGRVRLFVSNRGPGRVGSTFCRVGSGPRKVTRGQLCFEYDQYDVHWLWLWLLGFYDSTRDKDDTTVGVGHSRKYCNTGYDQSQGRRPSTLKCIGPISKGDIEPNHPSEINPNSDSRSMIKYDHDDVH